MSHHDRPPSQTRKAAALGTAAALGLAGAWPAPPARAGEGMWLPAQLPALSRSLREAGFQADPANLADLTRAPLNAVVKVGGATGAFVSADGLLLTNHHVAYGVIQYNATPGRNLIEDGFMAATRAQELPANPDFRVLVTTGFDKVTERVLAGAGGKTGRALYDAVEAASKALVAECERTPGVRCSVANMDYGVDYYLVTQLELRDVRLVHAPPRAIGNYGDEIDNFMWPRHSGDFTLLRAYVGPDGQPADYAPANRPYAAPAHLQIARDGVREGDFAMLAGYPGTTFRHRMAAEFDEQVNWRLPASIDVLGALLNAIGGAAAADSGAAVTYASQMQGLKNSRKRFQGEREGLLRSDAVARRRRDEQAMDAWLTTSPLASSRADIEAIRGVLAQASAVRERDLLLGLIGTQTQLLRASLTLQRLAREQARPDPQRESGFQRRDEPLIEGQLRQVQRRYAPAVEQALLRELIGRYQRLPDAQRLPELDAAFGRTPATRDARLQSAYAATALGDEAARLRAFADARDPARAARLAASDDRLLALAHTLLPALLRVEDQRKARDGALLRLRPAYSRALIAYKDSLGQSVYPDANGTLRVSFGKVAGFSPRDGVRYAPVTSVQGILEKNTGQVPFDAPAPLLAAIAKGDWGSTADPELGTQTVNFLTDLDTTGGNSGSPVLDARGQLVGLNFDSNWEAVSASWMYDPRYKRAVHVDLRYLRWLLAKVYPAPALLRELNLPDQ